MSPLGALLTTGRISLALARDGVAFATSINKVAFAALIPSGSRSASTRLPIFPRMPVKQTRPEANSNSHRGKRPVRSCKSKACCRPSWGLCRASIPTRCSPSRIYASARHQAGCAPQGKAPKAHDTAPTAGHAPRGRNPTGARHRNHTTGRPEGRAPTDGLTHARRPAAAARNLAPVSPDARRANARTNSRFVLEVLCVCVGL